MSKQPTPIRPRDLLKATSTPIHPFDLIHGVETSGLVPAANLVTGHPNDEHVTAYYGVAPSILRTLIDLWRETPPPEPIYAYTFIEPAYGDVVGNTYRRGSSQHPRDGLAAGDRLVARVYNTLRQSPVWHQSMLIITYDEHGGFYDHVAPGVARAVEFHNSSRIAASRSLRLRAGAKQPRRRLRAAAARGRLGRQPTSTAARRDCLPTG